MNIKEELNYRSKSLNQTIFENDLSLNNTIEPVSFKSVFRIANILHCLSKGINSITGIANICNLNKSTVYRLLQSSEKAGLTMRDPFSHRYFLGPLITEIASNPYVPHEQLVLCAIRDMNSISEYSGESVGLHVLTGFHNMLLVHEIPSTHDIRIVVKNRIHTGLHTGATCKSLLSLLKGKMLKMVLDNLDFKPITKCSIASKEELLEQLKQVNKLGYATDFSEKMVGVMCLSVPIKNYVLPAAISILGPEDRVKPKINDYIDRLLSSSVNIEKGLSQLLLSYP